ncbi:urease accessory protein UreD [Actibacterium pelagium]|nr:urease accessory protein UreD [Actibacterium pelagium]
MDGQTRLDDLRQAGSMKVVFPRASKGSMTAVLVNTAGGVTGGDQFAFEARAGQGTHLTLTTQAAERTYRAQPGEMGQITNRLTLDPGAQVNWLPQETILFQGSSVRRRLNVDMAADARLCLAEPLVFGRAAMGEVLTNATFQDRIEIRREGKPLYLDALSLTGDVAAHLARPNIANGAGAMVTVVYAAPDAVARLDAVRAHLPDTAGASLIQDGLLALRILAADSHDLRTSLVPILTFLSDNTLPRPWMI